MHAVGVGHLSEGAVDIRPGLRSKTLDYVEKRACLLGRLLGPGRQLDRRLDASADLAAEGCQALERVVGGIEGGAAVAARRLASFAGR